MSYFQTFLGPVLISIGILCLLIVSGFNGTLVGTESYGYGYGYSYGYYYETPTPTPTCSPTYVGGGGFIIYKNQTAVCPIIENNTTDNINIPTPIKTDNKLFWIIFVVVEIILIISVLLYLNWKEG